MVYFMSTLSVQLSKKYGSIFTVHFGPKKVVVLAGYKTVKQALVNQAEDFGDRDITPAFYDFNQGHGNDILVFCWLCPILKGIVHPNYNLSY